MSLSYRIVVGKCLSVIALWYRNSHQEYIVVDVCYGYGIGIMVLWYCGE